MFVWKEFRVDKHLIHAQIHSTVGKLYPSLYRYILAADLGLRMECCFLSGYFFKVCP